MDFIEVMYDKYPVMKNLNKDFRKKFENSLIYKKINALEYVKSVGISCDGIPLIISGEINICRVDNEGNETNLYNMKVGEFCHEALSCILKLTPLDIVAKSIYDSELILIPNDIFKEIFLNDIEFMKYIYVDLYEKFRGIIEEKEETLHESLSNRLWNKLINSNTKYIYITHEVLAKELGTSREVISRKLKILEKSGKVKLGRGKIELIK